MEMVHSPLLVLLFCAFAVHISCAKEDFSPISDGFYLPERDIFGQLSHGVKIFASVPGSCVNVVKEPRNDQASTFYENSESFYQHVASSAGISVNLKGAFTMGTTLATASNFVASFETSVSGSSLDVYATKEYTVLDKDCINRLSLSPELLRDLKNLPRQISAPEQKSSWLNYDVFLRKYGSHLVSEVHRGSRLLQWTFAQTSKQYSKKNFTIRACVDLAKIPTQAGLLGISPCGNYTNEKIQEAMSMSMSNKLVLKGGKAETRGKLDNQRTPALIQRFLQEAQSDPGDIRYRYVPVWEILKMHFMGTDQANFQRSVIMEQYYKGFLDFGCHLQQASGLDLRKFQHKKTPQESEFVCTLAHVGCHDDDDCHLAYNIAPTYCHGRTCVQAEDILDAGSKQNEKLSIRLHREGHYDEPPNTSCYYAVGPKALCHYDHDWTGYRHQIWPIHEEEVNYGLSMSLHRKFNVTVNVTVPHFEL